MKNFFRKPINVFFTVFTALFLLFFLSPVPINLFDGAFVEQNGLQTITRENVPLSLSYFIGLGYEESDMIGIKDFYLMPKGYAMAVIFMLGIPALAAYRVYLGNRRKEL